MTFTRSNITGVFTGEKTDGIYTVTYTPSLIFQGRGFTTKEFTVVGPELSNTLDQMKLELIERFNALSTVPNYRIYGKRAGQRIFRAMDVKAGKQVANLIYATLFTKPNGDNCLERITEENPDWKFELRHV